MLLRVRGSENRNNHSNTKNNDNMNNRNSSDNNKSVSNSESSNNRNSNNDFRKSLVARLSRLAREFDFAVWSSRPHGFNR